MENLVPTKVNKNIKIPGDSSQTKLITFIEF